MTAGWYLVRGRQRAVFFMYTIVVVDFAICTLHIHVLSMHTHTHTHIFALSLQVTVMLAPMVVETPDGTSSGSLLHFILWPCIGGVLLLIAAAILLYFVSHL